jgi:hypothetical protein
MPAPGITQGAICRTGLLKALRLMKSKLFYPYGYTSGFAGGTHQNPTYMGGDCETLNLCQVQKMQ